LARVLAGCEVVRLAPVLQTGAALLLLRDAGIARAVEPGHLSQDELENELVAVPRSGRRDGDPGSEFPLAVDGHFVDPLVRPVLLVDPNAALQLVPLEPAERRADLPHVDRKPDAPEPVSSNACFSSKP
jgi:hypothetical protein